MNAKLVELIVRDIVYYIFKNQNAFIRLIKTVYNRINFLYVLSIR